MILVDANVLLYAYDPRSEHHERCRRWVERTFSGEELVFSEISTGAQNDLQRATDIARSMVTEYGMSDRLGPLQFGQKEDQVFLGRDFAAQPDYSDRVASDIDAEIKRIIEDAYAEAKRILSDNRKKMDKIAKTLIKSETIEGKELDKLLGHNGKKKKAAEDGQK